MIAAYIASSSSWLVRIRALMSGFAERTSRHTSTPEPSPSLASSTAPSGASSRIASAAPPAARASPTMTMSPPASHRPRRPPPPAPRAALRSGDVRGIHRLVVVVAGQDQGLDVGVRGAYVAAHLDSRAVTEPGIEHRDVRGQLEDRLGRTLGGPGLADDDDVTLGLEQPAQPATHDLVVVEQEHADRLGGHVAILPVGHATIENGSDPQVWWRFLLVETCAPSPAD